MLHISYKYLCYSSCSNKFLIFIIIMSKYKFSLEILLQTIHRRHNLTLRHASYNFRLECNHLHQCECSPSCTHMCSQKSNQICISCRMDPVLHRKISDTRNFRTLSPHFLCIPLKYSCAEI
jgi:hypothetical protein